MKKSDKAELKNKLKLSAALAVLTLSLSFPAYAQNDTKVTDQAGILTQDEIDSLQEQYKEIADNHDMDIALLTVDGLGGKDIETFTDDAYYDYNYGLGDNDSGILFVIDMDSRDFHFTTNGDAKEAITDYQMDVVDEDITPDLKDEDYYDAFKTFGEKIDNYYTCYENDDYTSLEDMDTGMPIGMRVLIAVFAGLIVTLIVMAILFSQLKSVHKKETSADYIRKGSFHITRSRDIFLYRERHRVKIERDEHRGGGHGGSSTHTNSHGGTSGGHTGHF